MTTSVDRINDLPDDILLHILSFLPTKLTVSTSVLSTRWRYLHTLISTIHIESDLSERDTQKLRHFNDFMERLLLSPLLSIQTFTLKWFHYMNPVNVSVWVDALISGRHHNNIRELELLWDRHIMTTFKQRNAPCYIQFLPASLFTCETLVALKLVDRKGGLGCLDMKIPVEEPNLPNLKILHIRNTAISGNQVEKLLSGCPLLDELVLDELQILYKRASAFRILNDKLKILTIRIRFIKPKPIQIIVSSSDLVYFNLCVRASKPPLLSLPGTPSLAQVVIGGDYLGGRTKTCANGHEYQVLKQIDNVQSLQLHDYIILELYERDLRLPLLNKLTHLTLTFGFLGFRFNPRCLEDLLTRCVVLETLVFEQQEPTKRYDEEERIEYLLQQARLGGLLCHLKTFKFKLYELEDDEAEALMEILEFFLNNAKVLEELTVLDRDFPSVQQSEIMRELSTLPRVSKKCQLFFDEWKKE